MSDLPGVPLNIPVPPMLEQAVEYTGKARYFALYWTPAGDEVMVTDGRSSHDGGWQGYQAFVDHPIVVLALADRRYDLGSSEFDATHWLVIDRQTRTAALAPRGEVKQFLKAQHPPLPHLDLAPEQWQAINQRLGEEVRVHWEKMSSFDVMAALRRKQAIISEMTRWLDARLPKDWYTQLVQQIEGTEQSMGDLQFAICPECGTEQPDMADEIDTSEPNFRAGYQASWIMTDSN